MSGDFDSERESLCGLIEEDHLIAYATITHKAQWEGSIAEELASLIEAGYGNSLKEVSEYFSNHFRECSLCADYYNEALKLLTIIEAIPAHFEKDPMVLHKFRPGYYRQWRNLSRRFPIEHMDLEIDSYDLRSYIGDKYRLPHHHKPNEDYERHIQNCEFCRSFDKLSSQALVPRNI